MLNFDMNKMLPAKYISAALAFPREERFRDWLKIWPNALGSRVNMNFAEDPDIEQPIGPQRYDLKFTDTDTDKYVPTELQFGESDERHHSKIVRCFTNLENTDVAIWVAESFRDDYVQSISDMNNQYELERSIYLVEFRVSPLPEEDFQIHFFTLIGPSPTAKLQKHYSKQDQQDKEIQRRFLEMVQERSRQVMPGYFNQPPTSHGMLKHYPPNTNGICYEYSVTATKTSVGLAFVAKGSGDGEDHRNRNISYFKYITETYGERIKNEIPFELEEGKGDVEKKLIHSRSGLGYRSSELQWGATIDNMVSKMKQLIDATEHYLPELQQLDLNIQQEEIQDEEVVNGI